MKSGNTTNMHRQRMMLVMACNNHLSRSGSFPIEESSDNESIICNRAVLSEYFSSRNFWAMTKSSFPEVIPRIIKSADAFRATQMSFNVLTFAPLRPCSSIEMKLSDLSTCSASCSCVKPALSRDSLILCPIFSSKLFNSPKMTTFLYLFKKKVAFYFTK